MITVHHFESTGDAYDEVQCNAKIKTGDVLWIPSEEVIGIAHTWPFAVTKNYGKFHVLLKTEAADRIRKELESSIVDANILAAELGYEIR